MAVSYPRPQYRDSSSTDSSYRIALHPETVRMWVYVLFWFMIGLAIVSSRMFVVDILAAGVDKSVVPQEKWACGPFDRKGGEFGLEYGEGFDFRSQTHLHESFGFPNICTNWDYHPAREITALYESIWEYSLSVYLFLELLTIFLAARRGDLPKWFWNVSKYVYPLLIFLGASFRMVFVIIATDDVGMHTAGFLCIQLVLMAVAISNTVQIFLTGQSYPDFFMGKARTRMWASRYIALNSFISFFKVTATIQIILSGGSPPAYYKYPLSGDDFVLGQLVDYIWMFFNALAPFGIAYVRKTGDDYVIFEISLPKRYDGDSSDDEAGQLAEMQGFVN